MVHEGKKPFECAVCSSEFSKIGDLKTHIGMVHEGKIWNIVALKFIMKRNLLLVIFVAQ